MWIVSETRRCRQEFRKFLHFWNISGFKRECQLCTPESSPRISQILLINYRYFLPKFPYSLLRTTFRCTMNHTQSQLLISKMHLLSYHFTNDLYFSLYIFLRYFLSWKLPQLTTVNVDSFSHSYSIPSFLIVTTILHFLNFNNVCNVIYIPPHINIYHDIYLNIFQKIYAFFSFQYMHIHKHFSVSTHKKISSNIIKLISLWIKSFLPFL